MSSPLAVISVISHSPAVVTEFFAGLERLASEDPTVIFLFGDDSDNPVSKGLLEEFARLRPGTVVIGPAAGADQRVWRRAAMKDRLLGTAVELGCSHALVVDSNLLLPPPLMAHLVSLQLDIVAEVSWSEQEAGAWALPSVWQSDFYSLFGPELAAAAPSEQSAAANAFLAKLRQPGTYHGGSRQRLHPGEQVGDRGGHVVQGHREPQLRRGRPAFQRQGRCPRAVCLG